MDCPICNTENVKFAHRGGDAFGRTRPAPKGTVTLSCRCSLPEQKWLDAGGTIPDERVDTVFGEGSHDADPPKVAFGATLEGREDPVSFECVATWWFQFRWTMSGCRVDKVGR